MSLCKNDKKQIKEWFKERNRCINNSSTISDAVNGYFHYRDKIFNKVFFALEDLFNVKKNKWKREYGIDEDDSVSIIHDALLMAIDNYNVDKSDFTTYLWNVLDNRAKVFISPKNSRKRNFNTPDHSLEYLSDRMKFLRFSKNDFNNSYLVQLLSEYISDKHNEEIRSIDYKFLVQLMVKQLTNEELNLLQQVFSGYSFTDIANRFDVSKMTVTNRLNNIRKKLGYLKPFYE